MQEDRMTPAALLKFFQVEQKDKTTGVEECTEIIRFGVVLASLVLNRYLSVLQEF